MSESVEELLLWIDDIPLSRPRRNIGRDFSDGVLLAEVIHFFLPRFVELHNYNPASSVLHKRQNWATLERKVLAKLGLDLSERFVNDIIQARPGAIERLLNKLREKIGAVTASASQRSDRTARSAGAGGQDSPSNVLQTRDLYVQDRSKSVSDLQRGGGGSLISSPRAEDGDPSAAGQLVAQRQPAADHRRQLARLQRQLVLQEEELAVLKARVSRLERLSELKDREQYD